jgi:predicted ATPase
VRFGVLGPLEVRSDSGDAVEIGGPRPRSLLAMLVLDAGRVVGVERLVDGIYGDAPPGDAANALQSQVSRLRRRLGGLIELHPAGYRLAVDPEQVDVHRFERLAGEGRRALAGGDHAGAARVLGEALGLWRGPPLAGVAAPFAAAQVARLEEVRVAAAEDHAEAALALGEHAGLIAGLRELVEEHPLRERLRGQFMRALYAAGRQAEALAVFEDGRRRLADELGADPSAELAEIHLAVLRAAEPSAHNGLPAQLTSFVGREADLARIRALLGTSRLVTLTGPGGAGKTRLAVEAATRAGTEVSFVDFSAAAEVPGAVLAALGLRESGLLPSTGEPSDAAARLVAALAGRSLLLVLDNCEHVITEAARLAHRLLAGAPELRILATSREPLGITGEALHPLPPLDIEPAVRLFADRAAAVRPDFTVTGAVRRICAALDGLPLAIELAAARLRTLTVEDIESRLDDRFRLLSRGSRTAAPRHQTLTAVVEWSWDLLDLDERRLAARLAVFAGGATAEAAELVCGWPGAQVDELLAGLVDKSFMDIRDGRYRMLDTIRAFCLARIMELGGQHPTRRAHAEYFLSLASEADPHLRRAGQLTWLARLRAEHDNLQAAVRFAVTADTGLALAFFGALSWYWYLAGLRTEIAPLAAELLAKIGPEAGEEYVLCVLWDPGRGPEHVERAKAIADDVRVTVRQPYAMVGLALFAGPPDEDDPVTPMRELLASTVDPWFAGLYRFAMGYVTLYAGGDLEAAERECEVALERFRETGDRWGLAQALDALAMFADTRGDSASALKLTDQALDVVGQLGAAEEFAELRGRRADRLLRAGEVDAAHADYELAAELAGRTGLPAVLALARCGLGEIARRRGDLRTARHLHETALAVSTEDWANAGARCRVLTALGRVAEDEGNPAEARSLYRQAIDLATDNRMPAEADEALTALARLDGDE